MIRVELGVPGDGEISKLCYEPSDCIFLCCIMGACADLRVLVCLFAFTDLFAKNWSFDPTISVNYCTDAKIYIV